MADMVRKVQYFKVGVPDKAGEAARILDALRDAGVNLLAFSGFPRRGRSQLDFVPADAAAFRRVAKQAKLKLEGPKTCFLIEGTDRAGALAAALDKLGRAGVNVRATQAVAAGAGRWGAILWVDPRAAKKAADVLGAK